MKYPTLFIFLLLATGLFAQALPGDAPRWQHGPTMTLALGGTDEVAVGSINGNFVDCRWNNCDFNSTTTLRTATGLGIGYQALRQWRGFSLGPAVEIQQPDGQGPATLLTLSALAGLSERNRKVNRLARLRLGATTPLGLGGGDQRGLNVGYTLQPSLGLAFGQNQRVAWEVGYRYTHLNYRFHAGIRRAERRLQYRRWVTGLTFNL